MLDHLDDLISDFSVFHRVDNIYELEAVDFQRKAYRMAAYRGVMYERVRQEAERDESPSRNPGVTEIPATQTSLIANGLGDLFDFG